MKTILTKVDEIYTLMKGDKMMASSDSDFQIDYDVMKISKQNCDEIFSVSDVETLSDEYSHDSIWFNKRGACNDQEFFEFIAKKSFTDGFNKAMELNKDKLFTVEDMYYIFQLGFSLNGKAISKNEYNAHIKSLQKTERDVEICCYIGNGDKESDSFKDPIVTNTGIPKLDENGCLILRNK
jgi:hypothetical protein